MTAREFWETELNPLRLALAGGVDPVPMPYAINHEEAGLLEDALTRWFAMREAEDTLPLGSSVSSVLGQLRGIRDPLADLASKLIEEAYNPLRTVVAAIGGPVPGLGSIPSKPLGETVRPYFEKPIECDPSEARYERAHLIVAQIIEGLDEPEKALLYKKLHEDGQRVDLCDLRIKRLRP